MNPNNLVWIVDDDQSIRWVLEKALSQAGIPCAAFASADIAIRKLETQKPAIIISDIRMPGMNGLEFLKHVNQLYPTLPVIITTAHSDLDSAVSSYQKGAFEYLPKPFDIDEVIDLSKRALQHANDIGHVSTDILNEKTTEIIGEAPAMQEVFRAIGRLSHSNITVLINGESGTGKELAALALHKHSPRADKPFIALNMAAIPKDLMESELFGHEKGAFTGAITQRKGRFEQSNGGTLFLDEIGDMPAETQTRLLRVLADGEFYRVGGHTPVKVDVRIIAATHQNLEQLVSERHFREDLFHRINVIRIHLPRLRDRKEDIPKLSQYFLRRAAEELNAEIKSLDKEALQQLMHYEWPGNVRQLENCCRWITVMASGREVHVGDLPPEIMQKPKPISNTPITEEWHHKLAQWAATELNQGHKELLKTALPLFERIMIETTLTHTHGRKRDAALLLGWGRNTLTRKMQELQMEGADSD